MPHLDTTSQLSLKLTKQTLWDLQLGSLNQHVFIGIQGVKQSNYVIKGLDIMFGIPNAQDSEYTG